jgi:hypothetical protein
MTIHVENHPVELRRRWTTQAGLDAVMLCQMFAGNFLT